MHPLCMPPVRTQPLTAQAYADYDEIMDLTEELVEAASLKVLGSTEIEYQGQPLNLSRPFRRASMHDLVKDATGEHGVDG